MLEYELLVDKIYFGRIQVMLTKYNAYIGDAFTTAALLEQHSFCKSCLSFKPINIPLSGTRGISWTLSLWSRGESSSSGSPVTSLVVRFLPMLLPKTEDGAAKIDLSTLRTFRVLRPLKLVSGVPSEFVIITRRAKVWPWQWWWLAAGTDTCGSIWQSRTAPLLQISSSLLATHWSMMISINLNIELPQCYQSLSECVIWFGRQDGFWDDPWIFQLAHICPLLGGQ